MSQPKVPKGFIHLHHYNSNPDAGSFSLYFPAVSVLCIGAPDEHAWYTVIDVGALGVSRTYQVKESAEEVMALVAAALKDPE